MGTFSQDLRYGFRMLVKSPGFAAVAIITLALGIGMTTAIFSVVYGVLLRPLPYEQPERIVQLRDADDKGGQHNFADPNFEDVREQSHNLRGLAEYAAWQQSVAGGSEPVKTTTAYVSRDFFPILRVRPMMGRGFAAEDHQFGAAPVALVGYGYWKQFLGATPDLSSKKLIIEDKPVAIVGVLPQDFDFPPRAEIWLPREIVERLPSRTAHNWRVIGRLADAATLAQARSELNSIAARLKQQYGQDTTMSSVAVIPLLEALTSNVRPALWVLLGAVGFLLLIACANVANLLLVQSAGRQREIAIRFALGASRARVIRQLLAETLLLSLSGGALGVLAAVWGLQALLAVFPGVLPPNRHVEINTPVLAFSFLLCVIVAAALGVFSGLRSSYGVQQSLAAGGRSQTGEFISHRIGRAIVAGQLAVTLALVAGAALLGRSLLHVLSVDPGFRTERVLTMNLALSDTETQEDKVRRIRFLDDLFAKLHAIPGVAEAGGTSSLPFTGYHPDGTYVIMNAGQATPTIAELEKMWHDKSRTGGAVYACISDGFLRTLGVPLLQGRLFGPSDSIDTPHVAVISESLAREKWPGQDPLGRQIEFGNMDGDLRLLTVVGVVGDIREENLEHPPSPTVYVNYRQRPRATGDFKIVLRTTGDAPAVISAARQALRELDPNVPPSFATFEQVVSGSVQPRRFNVLLVGVFAATALLLAIAGMYGVMAHLVTRRTNEIGVRMALGATRGSILRLILGHGLITAFIGVGIGVVAALAVTRTIRSMLFGLSASDPATFLAVALLLTCVALLASFVPARRATTVDPMVALRNE